MIIGSFSPATISSEAWLLWHLKIPAISIHSALNTMIWGDCGPSVMKSAKPLFNEEAADRGQKEVSSWFNCHKQLPASVNKLGTERDCPRD